jgi:hypothetical protein
LKKYAQWGFLVTLSAILTAVLAFIGGAPQRSLRKASGPVVFWSLNLVAAIVLYVSGAPVLAVAYFAIAFTCGMFAELEDMGFSRSTAGLATLGLATIVGAASFSFWVGSQSGDWMTQVLTATQPMYDQILQIKPDLEVAHKAVLFQMPGALLLMLMISAYISLLGERMFSRWLGIDVVSDKPLTMFKAPDELIWVLLASLLAAFFQQESQPLLPYLGSNVLMVVIGIYFFQGLAVTSHFFNRIKLGVLWQILAYMVILASQLFVLVAMVGVADLWMEFRENKKDNRSKEKIKTENY